MSSLFKESFGLEISNTSLKAIELAYTKNGIKIVNYSYINLEAGIVADDCVIINKDAFIEAVKKLILKAKRGPINSRNVIISIPHEKTFSHQIEIPKENIKNDEFIKEAATDFIPIELSEAIIDYKLISEKADKKSVILNFVAIQKNLIETLISILNKTGLNVIAVDTDRNSLIRYCYNKFQKNEKGFLIFDIDFERSIITINTPYGIKHSINTNASGSELNKKLKEILKTQNNEDLNTLLIQFKQDPNKISPENRKKISDTIKNDLNDVIQKTNNLIKAIESQEILSLKTIYLLGAYSQLPGMKESFSSAFPNTEIRQTIGYMKMEAEIEMFFPVTIGLAMRGAIPEENEKQVNLVPIEKKEELDMAKATPKIMKYSLWTYLVLIILLLLTGIMITDSYLNYKITEQEAKLYNDKAQNPYLTQVAKATQQKIQLENQINTILENTFPVSLLIDRIDDFNVNGIAVMSLNYNISSQKSPELRLRSKVADRNLTEEFILELEKVNYFSEINSPLSNLVGKGERFVNIDFIISRENILKAYNEQAEKTEEKTKSPALPASNQNDESTEEN